MYSDTLKWPDLVTKEHNKMNAFCSNNFFICTKTFIRSYGNLYHFHSVPLSDFHEYKIIRGLSKAAP